MRNLLDDFLLLLSPSSFEIGGGSHFSGITGCRRSGRSSHPAYNSHNASGMGRGILRQRM